LRAAIKKQGARVKVVAPHVGGAKTGDGKLIEADLQLAGAPSTFFDAVAVIVSEAGARELSREAPRSTSCRTRLVTSRRSAMSPPLNRFSVAPGLSTN